MVSRSSVCIANIIINGRTAAFGGPLRMAEYPHFIRRAKNIPYPAGIQRSRIGVVSHFRRSEGGQRYGR